MAIHNEGATPMWMCTIGIRPWIGECVNSNHQLRNYLFGFYLPHWYRQTTQLSQHVMKHMRLRGRRLTSQRANLCRRRLRWRRRVFRRRCRVRRKRRRWRRRRRCRWGRQGVRRSHPYRRTICRGLRSRQRGREGAGTRIPPRGQRRSKSFRWSDWKERIRFSRSVYVKTLIARNSAISSKGQGICPLTFWRISARVFGKRLINPQPESMQFWWSR